MKIGIDGRYAEGKLTGIGQYIQKLVWGLSKKGHHIALFYTKPPLSPLTEENIYSVVLPSKNRYCFEQILLPKALKKEGIELYHAAGNLGIPLFCPCPSVLTVHDIIPLLYPHYFSFSRFPFISQTSYFLRMAISLCRTNKIMADSQFTKDSLLKKFGVASEKITVVPLGIEAREGKGELPEGVEKGKYIINNGGIDIRKNLFNLIEAFAALSPRFPKIKLVITGENPPLKQKLQTLAEKLGVADLVVFPGYVDEETLWALVRQAACLCLPTEIEGFGFPVLAGMAAGVPVVTSHISSLLEVADEAAILVNPDKVEEIAIGLEKILTDRKLRESLVEKGLEQAKKFPWEKTISETINIYQEALK